VTLLLNSNGSCIEACLLRSCIPSEPLSIHEVEVPLLRLSMVVISPLHSRISRCAGADDSIELVKKIPRKFHMPNV